MELGEIVTAAVCVCVCASKDVESTNPAMRLVFVCVVAERQELADHIWGQYTVTVTAS